jgi:hypothetical protein
MADKKISALTGATTPLAGTEVLPVVQSGATVKVSVANLTAGRAISATQLTLTTGNLIVSDGKGIDFSATSGTGTSELLNDYEEGTWTPNQGAGIVLVGTFSSSATYTKIGRQVTLVGRINGSTSVANVTNGGVLFSNAPFVPSSNAVGVLVNDAQNQTGSGVLATNSTFYITPMSATPTIYFSITYFV